MKHTIYTRYYNHGGEIIRINHGSNVGNAVMRVVYHMQMGTYPAWSAEVYSEETGTLHVVVRRTTCTLSITYRDQLLETGDHSKKIINFKDHHRGTATA